MPLRATSVVRAGAMSGCMPFDSIELPHDGRYRRRITMRSDGGLVFLLDLPEATQLQHGDGLLLEDGRIISVVAAQEPVIEITAADPQQLARLAWHIGNRHVRAEILRDRIRIMPDAVIETMARRLGGKIRSILARFEPEGGAYSDAGLGAGAQASHRHEPHHQ